MLNNNGTRELAYIVKVDSIQEHPNADRLEIAKVGGWNCVVGIGDFVQDQPAVYFETDSQLPEVMPFVKMDFLASKHFKIKVQKIRGIVSDGLLVPLSEFGWTIDDHPIGTFVTKELNVTYNVPEDNVRKGNKVTKSRNYDSMCARHPKVFSTRFVKSLMRTKIGRNILYLIFGRKKDSPKDFPTHFPYIHVSDEERVENMPWILKDKQPWIKTTKIDGTSSTYILERKPHNKFEFYVCSRHVRQLTPNQSNYHSKEANVYWDMAIKYNIEKFLKDMLDKHPNWSYVCLQGETAGIGLQGNPHKFPDVRFFGFNFIESESGRWNSEMAANLCAEYAIPWVPIVDTNYILPDDFDEFKLSADGDCEAPGATGLREGYVYRSLDGKMSFKNVSNKYRLKYQQ